MTKSVIPGRKPLWHALFDEGGLSASSEMLRLAACGLPALQIRDIPQNDELSDSTVVQGEIEG
jgi:hypothetical protein